MKTAIIRLSKAILTVPVSLQTTVQHNSFSVGESGLSWDIVLRAPAGPACTINSSIVPGKRYIKGSLAFKARSNVISFLTRHLSIAKQTNPDIVDFRRTCRNENLIVIRPDRSVFIVPTIESILWSVNHTYKCDAQNYTEISWCKSTDLDNQTATTQNETYSIATLKPIFIIMRCHQ